MPKLTGVFEGFKNLSDLPLENISRWLKFKIEPHVLENYIAGRILYPQTVPISKQEMQIDLAILREVISNNSGYFYNSQKGEVVMPQEYSQRFGPLTDLIWTFADTLSLKEVTKLYIKDWAGTHPIGSIIYLPDPNLSDEVVIKLEDQEFKLRKGSLTVIPFLKKQIKLTINQSPKYYLITGGEGGIFVDLRPKKI